MARKSQTRDRFYMYINWESLIKVLDPEGAKEVFLAIFALERSFTSDKEYSPPTFSNPLADAVFQSIKEALDRDFEEYKRTCEKNSQNRKKGWEKKETVPGSG